MEHRCGTLPFHIVCSIVKRNGIVFNDFGNVFLMRTVHVATASFSRKHMNLWLGPTLAFQNYTGDHEL